LRRQNKTTFLACLNAANATAIIYYDYGLAIWACARMDGCLHVYVYVFSFDIFAGDVAALSERSLKVGADSCLI
jgi:hypothetical protein